MATKIHSFVFCIIYMYMFGQYSPFFICSIHCDLLFFLIRFYGGSLRCPVVVGLINDNGQSYYHCLSFKSHVNRCTSLCFFHYYYQIIAGSSTIKYLKFSRIIWNGFGTSVFFCWRVVRLYIENKLSFIEISPKPQSEKHVSIFEHICGPE